MNQQDQIYIDSVQEQIDHGMYAHLFTEESGDGLAVGKDMVFLDIGANIGLVSIYAAPFCKKIVAVEPCIETFMELQRRTSNYPNISCDRHALSTNEHNVGFYINDINFTASSTVNTYGTYIPNYVMGIRLSKLLEVWKLTHVDVCKVDTEGAEGEALNLSELESASGIIKTYYIETHNCPKTTWEHKLGTIVGNLARCGYSKMTIDGMAITATRP